jgi:Ca2+/Na+ antiporter
MSQLTAEKAGILLLLIAAAGWFIAARAAADALTRGKFSPGRAAFGYWLPTLIAVLLAIFLDKPEMALRIIFASSVACLTLSLGIVTLAARNTHPTSSRKMWGFILPAALICLMIGFAAQLRWIDAAILAMEGLALIALWNDRLPPESSPPMKILPRHAIQLGIALVAVIVAALVAIRGAENLGNFIGLPGTSLVTAILLAPMLVLPMIGAGTSAAYEGHYDQSIDVHIGYVLLNLCALIPLATIVWLSRPYLHMPIALAQSATTLPTTLPVQEATDFLAYPLAVWRIDTVLLAVLGLFLLPVAIGKWTLHRAEGFGLIGAYMIYMVLTAVTMR